MRPIIIRDIVVIESLIPWLHLSSERNPVQQQDDANELQNLAPLNRVVAYEMILVIIVLLDFV